MISFTFILLLLSASEPIWALRRDLCRSPGNVSTRAIRRWTSRCHSSNQLVTTSTIDSKRFCRQFSLLLQRRTQLSIFPRSRMARHCETKSRRWRRRGDQPFFLIYQHNSCLWFTNIPFVFDLPTYPFSLIYQRISFLWSTTISLVFDLPTYLLSFQDYFA